MGFYGNITSTNKTQFTFDRIYPSRFVMNENINVKGPDGLLAGDGVFVGRFVLVDYGDGTYFPIFKKDDSGVFYADASYATIMTTELCKPNDIFQYQAGAKMELYKATGKTIETVVNGNTISHAEFENITESEAYVVNYNKDIEEYGAGRGYDGTVWQKTFANGLEKYVMVAELNSVVPTFKVTADAPTMNPLPPHFDKQSNNVAYWLHAQPQWGMRVKKADTIVDENGKQVTYSDEDVTWITTTWDENTFALKPEKTETVKGSIYFNKAGLSREKQSFVEVAGGDKISVTPTGKSGAKYNSGHGTEAVEAPDIQEISIILPSVGNAISEAWDVVYGEPTDTDGKRNLDIE